MSIPVRFDWYSSCGELLASNRGVFTISYTDNPYNVSFLGRMLEGALPYCRHHVHNKVRYAVPLTAKDYMFDLEDPTAILPNKFKIMES